jgi:hypothetical protein
MEFLWILLVTKKKVKDFFEQSFSITNIWSDPIFDVS